MPEIIGVKFKEAGKAYYFDPDGNTVKKGQKVIVETAQGTECGVCAISNTNIVSEPETPLKKMVRIANEEDEKRLRLNEQKQKEAFSICNKKIADHGLDMKLVSVEYTFDNSKILFYFTADGRVDFRALVKDLASVFRTRIELRQVGVRDEAKILGGLGICGREFCCAGFLNSFQPVSIKMAKEQNLSLNPVKISGTCGRLMCCLKYEQDAYEYLNRISPRPGAVVRTPGGRGVVTEAALLTRKVKVKLDGSTEVLPEIYDMKDIRVLTDGKGGHMQSQEDDMELYAAQMAEAAAAQPKTEEVDPFGKVRAPGRPARNDRNDRAPRPQRGNSRGSRPANSGRDDRREKAETSEKSEKPERQSRPGRNDRAVRNDRPARNNRVNNNNRPPRPPRSAADAKAPAKSRPAVSAAELPDDSE